MARIGIYAGTFDPVHTGHITFALQAVDAAKLDELYFLPERRPRAKQGVEHFGHRVAMLKRALKPHPRLNVIELVDSSFTIKRTLPALRQLFEGDQLVFLFGSDIIPALCTWPNAQDLLHGNELIIGLRNKDSKKRVKQIVAEWSTTPQRTAIIETFAPDVSSGKVRSALRKHQTMHGILSSVERYSDRHWLYISLDAVDTT